MRFLLDTCIMLYMLKDSGEMSNDVEAVVKDYGRDCRLILSVVDA